MLVIDGALLGWYHNKNGGMNMKKWMSLLLAMLMLLGCAPAMAEEKEPITITASYIEFGTADPTDAVNKLITDKFNIDIEMTGLPNSSYSSDIKIMATGGTLLDWMTSNFNYETYLSWANQGLVKPLPEGWEETYPNMYRAAKASGILDYLYVDGLVYCIPEVIYYNLIQTPKAYAHAGVFYRKDWLEKLGMEPWGDSVTLSQVTEFAAKAVEADLAGNGQTLGITGEAGHVVDNLMYLFQKRYSGFQQVDGKYIWAPAAEGTVQGVQALKKLYMDGVINPDFYLEKDGSQSRFGFTCGKAAVFIGNQNPSNVIDFVYADCKESGFDSSVEMAVLVDDTGVWRGTQANNYWQVNIFSPELSDETFARILEMVDWCYTLEFEEIMNMGLPGIDWEKNAEGKYTILTEYDAIRTKYPSINFWYCRCIGEDEFGLINPNADPVLLGRINDMYNTRAANADEYNAYIEVDYTYNFHASENKSNYSVNVRDDVVRLMVDSSIAIEDVPAEWNKVIETYRNMWEPLLNELNETYCK